MGQLMGNVLVHRTVLIRGLVLVTCEGEASRAWWLVGKEMYMMGKTMSWFGFRF